MKRIDRRSHLTSKPHRRTIPKKQQRERQAATLPVGLRILKRSGSLGEQYTNLATQKL